MQNTKEELHRIFGDLKTRLYEIENYKGDIIPDPTGHLYLRLDDSIFKLLPEDVLIFLGNVLRRIENVIEFLPELYNRISTYTFTTNSYNPFKQSESEYNVKTKSVIDNIFEDFGKELSSYKEKLYVLEKRLQNDISLLGESGNSNKLVFNLTVDELSAFLGILRDVGIIPENKTNNAISKAMALNLTTTQGGGTSPEKNAKVMGSPSLKTLKSIEDKMQTILKRTIELRREEEN